MRLRQEGLKTGRLLTCFPDASGFRNASLLFLVQGANDIEPLNRLDEALRAAPPLVPQEDEEVPFGVELRGVPEIQQLLGPGFAQTAVEIRLR